MDQRDPWLHTSGALCTFKLKSCCSYPSQNMYFSKQVYWYWAMLSSMGKPIEETHSHHNRSLTLFACSWLLSQTQHLLPWCEKHCWWSFHPCRVPAGSNNKKEAQEQCNIHLLFASGLSVYRNSMDTHGGCPEHCFHRMEIKSPKEGESFSWFQSICSCRLISHSVSELISFHNRADVEYTGWIQCSDKGTVVAWLPPHWAKSVTRLIAQVFALLAVCIVHWGTVHANYQSNQHHSLS